MSKADAGKPTRRSILVPVDFSEPSVAALLKGCELADCMDQSLMILHVVHDPAEMPGYYEKVTKRKKLLRIEDLAKDALESFVRDVAKRYPEIKRLRKPTTLLVVGLPVNRILEMVNKVDASMVVMGSQGRTGLKHLMLGSKAEQVVRLCPVPVLIVKGESVSGQTKT